MNATDLLTRTVSEVLAAHPNASRTFIAHGMGCVGCTFAPFETIDEVARVYAIDPIALATSLAKGLTQ